MPRRAKVPLFNWEEIVTKIAYCAFAGLIGGLGVGIVIAVAGAFPTAALSVIAVPIFAVVGIVAGAALGFFYGVGSCLWQGMKRAYQKRAMHQVDVPTEKLEPTNSTRLHQHLETHSPRRHSKASEEPLRDTDVGLRQRRQSTFSIKTDTPLFPAPKRRRTEPSITKENRSCFSRLLSCFH